MDGLSDDDYELGFDDKIMSHSCSNSGETGG